MASVMQKIKDIEDEVRSDIVTVELILADALDGTNTKEQSDSWTSGTTESHTN